LVASLSFLQLSIVTYVGISGNVHSWFTSYLHDRFQSISINGETSRRFEVKYGVPQGSYLGPLLFILYASKLFTIIERHLSDAHAYADDTQLYVSFNANSRDDQSAAVEAMQRCNMDIIYLFIYLFSFCQLGQGHHNSICQLLWALFA
jgi:hypothetical protein